MKDQIPITFTDQDPGKDEDYAIDAHYSASEDVGDESSDADAQPSPKSNSAELRISLEQRPRNWKRTVTMIGGIAAVGLIVAGAFEVYGLVTHSTHKVAFDVGPPVTVIYPEQKLDLAKIESTFPVSLHTSLDRFGPANCDTQTDQRITTDTEGQVVVQDLAVTKSKGKYTATLDGKLKLGVSSVNYDQQKIDVHGASGDVDVCIGTNEITDARHIVDVAVQHAGGIAAACALENPLGKQAIEKSVAEFVIHTDLAKGAKPEDVKVVFEDDYQDQAAGLYAEQVSSFNDQVGDAIDDYLKETDDHDDPKINKAGLIDCTQHQISLASNLKS